MPYYVKKHLLFIHIPKTGGSSLERYLEEDDYQILRKGHASNDIFPKHMVNECSTSPQHQTYATLYTYRDQLNLLFDDNLKLYTIVRNPYTRIMSDLFFLKRITPKSTKEEVTNAVSEFINELPHENDNHNIPQYDFLIDKDGNLVKEIVILNTETLSSDVKTYFNANLYYKELQNTIKVNYFKYLNMESIWLINNAYPNDFELFGYKKITQQQDMMVHLSLEKKSTNSDEPRQFLALITRCKDEFFIKEFCAYYLSQGVDKIFIVDDDSSNKRIYDNIISSNVEIIYSRGVFNQNGKYVDKRYKAEQTSEATKVFITRVKDNFEWVIFCDVDEFITTRKKQKNTIREEIITTFRKWDCVGVPWIMMSSNGIKKNPSSVLRTNVYRWDHDEKHPHPLAKFRCRHDRIEMKCIFRCDKFDKIGIHTPTKPVGNIRACDSIYLQKREYSNEWFDNLREDDIDRAHLICHHYRIISHENNLRKIETTKLYNQYTMEDLVKSDHSEIYDDTIKNKVKKLNFQEV